MMGVVQAYDLSENIQYLFEITCERILGKKFMLEEINFNILFTFFFSYFLQ